MIDAYMLVQISACDVTSGNVLGT